MEQSSVVWNSSLTIENKEDLERVQRAAVRIIIGKNFENYEEALSKVNLQKLEERRNHLSLKFAQKCTQNDKTEGIFPLKTKTNGMDIRNPEKFIVSHAHTERFKKSAIPSMQRILNDNNLRKRTPG